MPDTPTTATLNLDTEERFVPLRKQLGVNGFGVNQLTLQPGQRMRIHRHASQEELYLVIEGRLTVFIEREPHVIGVGELMRIGPEVRRQLANTHSERVTILALGSHGSDHQSRDAEAFLDWSESTGASPRDVPLPEDLPEADLKA